MTATDDHLDASHRNRLRVETMCANIGIGASIVLVVVIIAAIVWPPAATGLPDWGRAAIEKAEKAWGILGLLFAYVVGHPVTTMTRGYLDARLTKKADAV